MVTNAIEFASSLLKQGKLVAIPTETVYGLAADASQPDAINQIFLAKGRPSNHPLIVHLADVAQIWDWGKNLSPQLIQNIKQLAHHFWPGPLTVIIKKADWVPNVITGGQDTVAIRIPNHPLTLAVLKNMPTGVVAPSANRFGRISPTLPKHVQKELGDKVAYILDGGPCTVGLESTILNLSGEQPVILRPGMITQEQIAAVLNQPIATLQKQPKQNHEAIRAPGVLDSHYAPLTPFFSILDQNLNTTHLINMLTTIFSKTKKNKIALIGHDKTAQSNGTVTYHALSDDPEIFSQKIYHTLHVLDDAKFDYLFCFLNEKIVSNNKWTSVLDRLQKATLDAISIEQIIEQLIPIQREQEHV